MFLHLGADVMIPKKDIVAILDIQTRLAGITREYLRIIRGDGLLEVIGEPGKERSFIITPKKVYLSPISCTTLKKRAEEG
ncbi:MAG: extracellular matrix regulator RemB [Desulfotomaculales bacterium]